MDPGMIEDVLEVVESVCKRSSKKITKDWLLDSVAFPVLMQFIEYVFESLSDSKNGESVGVEGAGKN
ncbi:MAG: hypothetical protein PHW84_01860 [Methanosarcina sp.]|nr:hypothetical protein [Methanosarcina sp.]